MSTDSDARLGSNIWKLQAIRLLFYMQFFSAVLVPFFTDWGGISLAQVLYLNAWFFLCNFLFEVPTGSVADFVASLARGRERGESGGGHPTAIVTYTHHAAISMLRLLWEAGLSVPKHLSVATFSNSYPVSEVIPPLTVMALPTEEMGRTAAEMVLEQIRTSGAAPPRRMVLKETLIVRKSTAPPAAG